MKMLDFKPEETVQKVPLGQFATEVTERNSDRVFSDVRSVTNSSGLVRTSDYFGNTRTSEDTSNYKVVRPRMFVYNPSRVNVGSIGWLDETNPAIVSPIYVVFEVDQSRIDPRYLEHFLSSPDGKSQIESRTEVGARFRLTFDSISKVRVPLPPLSIQRKIVEILEVFIALDRELAAEVSARRDQLSHLRTRLLGAAADTERLPLGEVADVRTGQAPPEGSVSEDGPYPFVNAGTSDSGRISAHNTEGDVVTIPSRGQGGVGIARYQSGPFWCGPLSYRIMPGERLSARYLFHYLKEIEGSLRGLQQTGGTPALNRKELVRVEVPLPTIEEQRRISGILDKFDVLVNDSSIGLPAEIAARRTQFAYYREKLLTFQEASE